MTKMESRPRHHWAGMVLLALGPWVGAHAQGVDLVVTLVADQPAYMVEETEHYVATISNNGPMTATGVTLTIDHPLADQPFEASATCQPVPGPNPNGAAVCPPGSGTAPSPAFVRNDTQFSVVIPSIPAQSMLRIAFDNASRCERERAQGGSSSGCMLPHGNYTVTAQAVSGQTETDPGTNHASTNIFLYPPDSQYRIEVVSGPANAVPGEVVEYEFEVSSMGLNPSHMLRLEALIKGQAGDMTPPTWFNATHGPSASTLPSTRLLSIDCVSMSLGSYPPGQVFPTPGDPWQACPSTGLIPIPVVSSPDNNAPVRGFAPGFFLDDLPGTQLTPPGGGVMRFKARVEVGEPLCVTTPEAGYRELEFTVGVNGLYGTDLVAPGAADNTDSFITQVAASCQEADIEFTTSALPASLSLDGNGRASWVQSTTVTNLSSGPTAGTATLVPVEFGHFSQAFSETRSPLTCSSVPAGLCPDAAALLAGTVLDTSAAFRFSGVLDALPAGASVTFSQNITLERTACWSSPQALVDLRGSALPSAAVVDPNYVTTATAPPNYTSGVNAYLGNNGMQTVIVVGNLPVCPGGGGDNTNLMIEKTGPFASAADAIAGVPLIGQSAANPIADGSLVYFSIRVHNPDAANAVRLGQINDFSFFATNLSPADSGFVHTGTTLPDWGITCIDQPGASSCHELATSFQSGGHINSFRLDYDPNQHGGEAYASLAPQASLQYIVPYSTPVHLNRCHGPLQVNNQATAGYLTPTDLSLTTLPSITNYYIGGEVCTPGALQIEKEILAPATASSIPPSGLLSFRLVLSNQSATETLDIARLVDQPQVSGVDVAVLGVTCTSLTGGALCPTTPVVPGQRTPASGVPTPLAEPWHIDHEWGSVGDNTFPPGSSLEFVITYQLSQPTRYFGCFFNPATFSAESDPNGWLPDSDQAVVCPPPAPELSLQKQVDTQIVAPGAWVTYTLIVTNIGSAAADGALLEDPLPALLLASNPAGYTNVTCTDITASSSIPNPHGVVVCPPITSDANGLSAVIATFGPNTMLRLTYQARMPDDPDVAMSVANIATLTSPAPGGLSFGSGTAQSHQNVQVLAAPGGGTPPAPVAPVPAIDGRWIALLALGLLVLGFRHGWGRPS